MSIHDDNFAVATINAAAFRRMSARARFGAGEQSFPVAVIPVGKPNKDGRITTSQTSAYRACVKALAMARTYAKAWNMTETMAELDCMSAGDVFQIVQRDGMAAAHVGDTVFAVGVAGVLCSDEDVTDGTQEMAHENMAAAVALREANASRVRTLSLAACQDADELLQLTAG